MEDSASQKSNESVATSDEFDFVDDKPGASKTPTLNINNGDLNELKNALKEVLQEPKTNMDTIMSEESRKVGNSVFFSCPVAPGTDPLSVPVEVSPTEKQDEMKPDSSEEEYVDQDCTIFSGVTYLGAANINAPKSEAEIQRNMAILNEQSSDQGIKIAVSVPTSSQGVVVLYDASTHSVIARYEIHRILFYARGAIDSEEASCFAFTWSHGDTQESAIFQCHVFRCDIAEAVSRVSACFAKAFQRVPRSMSSSVASATEMTGSITTLPEARTLMYVFEVNLEIKEDDGRGTFSTVPKDRSGFKLRVNLDKQLYLSIRQVSDNGLQLFIERCFGVLIAPGRHVRHSDMQLLEMVQLGPTNSSGDKTSSVISASWDPTEPPFNLLNTETPKDTKQYMTVAVDLVIRGIQEPVRFQMETLVKTYSQNERFWYFQKRTLVQQFFLNLKEVVTGDLGETVYEVLGMETSGELDRNRLNLTLNLSSLIQSPSIPSVDSITPKDDYHSDGDEPLLSGTGLVSKDCSEDVLDNWADVLSRWKTTKQRPKQLSSLVRHGIPEALRGEVWQRLAGTEENSQMMNTYRILITKESACENVIQRDIARTFPANDYFKEAGGLGQDSLYKVSKAYAVYDSEVGYCQGLSFLAATLLLHMPEEQAFCVLVKLMYDYNLRDLYKDGFDNLYLRLYQLNRLIEEQLGTLWSHLREHSVETHMFASQWFLTLFTARFPLYFVFHVLDIFLLQGIDTLFQVSLALLTMCKKDLLQLDFEGILKYFRVQLPKKCRTEDAAKQIIKAACSFKLKKLKKYETEFIAMKDDWEIIMLDSEAADNAESEASEMEQLKATLTRLEDERRILLDENAQLKEMLKREITKAEASDLKNMNIINDYKLVRQRLEMQLFAVRGDLNKLKEKVSECEKCGKLADNRKSTDNISQYATEEDSKENLSPDQLKAIERIRELELELAQTKLAQVEAECRNQDLTHQLRATESELNTAKNSWPPWLSRTLTSIKEVANKKDFPHFTYSPAATPSFVSHVSVIRRESAPMKGSDSCDELDSRRESAPNIKDSQSCSSLKAQN
ncbi:rab GTPase-activating protein 1-like isoform X2 [Agrilus planipennis]|uniref:Rab GTPase-activating protein 1-like isoform X2 n=1 Tax=Agrilus planipennis TaxID=224129 RepID=A0A7F5RN44_AGRPL|nr:rab GTPase-activating protein 1-like isoform X2 [Agrilus planipennis]